MIELLIALFIFSFSLLTLAGLHLYIIKQKGQIEKQLDGSKGLISSMEGASTEGALFQGKGCFVENNDVF